MKTVHKILIGIIILLTIGLIGYSYFNVSGAEIEGVDEITDTSLVTITKRSVAGDELNEYILNEEQIERLKKLLTETNFKRVLSSEVLIHSEIYEIILNNNNQSLMITSLGGEYISVFHQFKGQYLKIKNPAWKETIEEIISLSN